MEQRGQRRARPEKSYSLAATQDLRETLSWAFMLKKRNTAAQIYCEDIIDKMLLLSGTASFRHLLFLKKH